MGFSIEFLILLHYIPQKIPVSVIMAWHKEMLVTSNQILCYFGSCNLGNP
jgi:hypothetical protein